MAHTLSAVKRLKQSRKRRDRNKELKSRIKTEEKKFLEHVKKNEADKAKSQLSVATSLLDRAARKGVLHRNQADRRKARLAAKLNATGASKGSKKS